MKSAVITRPRLGFLGLGWIGRMRLEAINAAGVAEIAAIADLSPEAAAHARRIAPHAAVHAGESGEELLHALFEDDLDGVVIATPSAQHAEQAIAALEHGLAVFCQKPLGRTAAECARVVHAARQADRLLNVDFSYRCVKGAERVRTILQSGELGRVFAANLIFHNAYGPDKAWFYDVTQAGGGCVIDLGVHLIDFALWAMDVQQHAHFDCLYASLFAHGKAMGRGGERHVVEDFASAALEIDEGAHLSIDCSWNLHAGCDAVIEATFFGEHGSVRLFNVNGSFYDFAAERFDRTTTIPLASLAPQAYGLNTAAVNWVKRLSGQAQPHGGDGAAFDPEVERMLQVARCIDLIYGVSE